MGSAKIENAILDHLAQVKMLSTTECNTQLDLLVGAKGGNPLGQLSLESVIKEPSEQHSQSLSTQHTEHTTSTTGKETGDILYNGEYRPNRKNWQKRLCMSVQWRMDPIQNATLSIQEPATEMHPVYESGWHRIQEQFQEIQVSIQVTIDR